MRRPTTEPHGINEAGAERGRAARPRSAFHELGGDLLAAATAYADAAGRATDIAERDHPFRQSSLVRRRAEGSRSG